MASVDISFLRFTHANAIIFASIMCWSVVRILNICKLRCDCETCWKCIYALEYSPLGATLPQNSYCHESSMRLVEAACSALHGKEFHGYHHNQHLRTCVPTRGYHAHRFPTQVPAMQHGTKCMHLRFLRGKNTPLRGCSCEECQNSTLDKTLEIVPTFLATARKWFAKHNGHFAASRVYPSQT